MQISADEGEILEKLVAGEANTESDVQKFCIDKIREFRTEYARLTQIEREAQQALNNVSRQMQRISDQADKYVDDWLEWHRKDEAAAGNGKDKDPDIIIPNKSGIVGPDGKSLA